MKGAPDLPAEIRVQCQVYPSEDPSKVLRAVKNVISSCSPELQDGRVLAVTKSPSALSIIYEQVRSRRVMGVFRRVLEANVIANSTWFYLNKQAAYVGTVSICEEESESPLGPIKVTLTSNKLAEIINWLAEL